MSKNNLKSGVSRVDARLLLQILHHIATHTGVAIPELVEVIGVSKASVSRLILNARDQYGVNVAWKRISKSGEYTILDWGVFSADRVASFINNNTE